jgi:sulfur carrier protein
VTGQSQAGRETVGIVINGVPRRLPDGSSLAGAVSLLTTAATGVAAAVNGQVVRRAAWESTLLAAGDQVEVITAVQGG